MPRLHIHVTCLLLLIGLCSVAQDAHIQGHADTYKGKTIGIYSYQDFIANTPQLLASTRVNDTGYFSLTVHNVKACQYMYLNIDNFNGSIYISPGSSYNVAFPPPDSTQYLNPLVSHTVDLTFINTSASDVNSMVIDFNEQWDIFWRQYYTYFVRKQATAILDSFRVTMQQRYTDVKDPYFRAYLDYTLAEIEINIMVGQKTLAKKYIKGKPVLYDNYEYMKFINDYFKDYLEEFAIERSTQGNEVNKYIANNDYPGLMEVLKINPLLRANDSLCELILLKGLYELYYTGDYDKDNIKAILHNLAALTKIDEDKTIANNILNSFSDVGDGNPAPEFTLKDMDGNLTSLIDFRGKYLYLCFFKSTVSECISEMDVMSALKRQYGKKINFVCISEDDSLSQLKTFMDQNKIYTWPFLFDKDRAVLKLYDVKTFPEFFLINAKGKFMRSPADPPSHGIQETFEQLTAKRNNPR